MGEASGMDAWFIHEKLVCNLLTDLAQDVLRRRIPPEGSPLYESLRLDALERTLAGYLASNPVASLAIEYQHGRLREGQLVWLEQAISFKGSGPAWLAVRNGSDPEARATFSARLDTTTGVYITGEYSAARLTCSSAPGQLSGTNRQFVLGYVTEVGDAEIRLRPVAIAHRWIAVRSDADGRLGGDSAHVWPSMVDQFSHVDFQRRLVKKDLEVLRDVPEESVKRAFADILSEPDVPKDWGGEQFDLWVQSMLTVEGRPLRTAIAFKGPAKFHPMTIADLGKNGDQIDRLAQTAADLMVVQHCHAITAPVVNMLKAYANMPGNPRRYMTINGYDTIRILRSSRVL